MHPVCGFEITVQRKSSKIRILLKRTTFLLYLREMSKRSERGGWIQWTSCAIASKGKKSSACLSTKICDL